MRTQNQRFLFFVTIAFVLVSCISTEKLTTMLMGHVSYIPQTKTTYVPFVHVDTTGLQTTDSIVSIKKTKSYFIPAIIFWAWNRTYDCEINADYMIRTFETKLHEKIQLYNVAKYIDQGQIYVQLKKVPNRFKLTSNGSVAFLFLAYSYQFQEMAYRENESFELTYTFTDNNGNKRSDTLSYVFPAVYQNSTYGSYSFVHDYIYNLKDDYERQCDVFVEKIIESL